MRSGIRIALDVGTVRIGVARSDTDGTLAVPVQTVPRDKRKGSSDIDQIEALVHEYDALEVIVGYPVALSGRTTSSTADAERFARRCAARLDRPVRLVDERLTTVSATSALRAAGQDSRTSRPVVDQVAAAILLQHALDVERASGNPPGELVT